MRVRLRAFGIHLLGSIALGALALALVFWLWYPSPLDVAVGVGGVFLLIVGVDVVMGPVLTLIVFNPSKKELVFDLAAIVLLQLAAFAYGIWTVAEGRPAWLVFNAGRFDVVRANEISLRDIKRAPAQYKKVPFLGPKWVAAFAPEDIEKRNQLTFEAVFAGVDLPQRPDLYQPLEAAAVPIREKARPLAELARYNPPESVEEVCSIWPSASGWLPMMSSSKAVTVLIDVDTAAVVAIVDLNPWQ